MTSSTLQEHEVVAVVEGRLSRFNRDSDKAKMVEAIVNRSVKFIQMFEGPDSIEWVEWVFRYEKIKGKMCTVVGRKCMMTSEAIELNGRWPGERIDRAIAAELKHRGLKTVPYPQPVIR